MGSYSQAEIDVTGRNNHLTVGDFGAYPAYHEDFLRYGRQSGKGFLKWSNYACFADFNIPAGVVAATIHGSLTYHRQQNQNYAWTYQMDYYHVASPHSTDPGSLTARITAWSGTGLITGIVVPAGADNENFVIQSAVLDPLLQDYYSQGHSGFLCLGLINLTQIATYEVDKFDSCHAHTGGVAATLVVTWDDPAAGAKTPIHLLCRAAGGM